jgi:insulysin
MFVLLQFLHTHGGMANAYTSLEYTNFFFDVSHEHLAPALDRFAQFFICPLFTASAAGREVNAVESENVKNLNFDQWRLFQLEKSTCDPAHPYSKFGTGNKATLETEPAKKGIDVRKALLQYHNHYFSSNIMALVVIGKESLEDLSDMVANLFVSVANHDISIPCWNGHPFSDSYLQIHLRVIPVKDVRTFQMTFPLPDMQPYYKSKPTRYVSHLLGHEGPGSILSLLKTRGLIRYAIVSFCVLYVLLLKVGAIVY